MTSLRRGTKTDSPKEEKTKKPKERKDMVEIQVLTDLLSTPQYLAVATY